MKVELRNVSKKYSGNNIYTLSDININIEDNDFCVLLGPSGCGKTTLLRMVAGLNSVTKGDLLFNGKRVNDLPPKDRDIAMVFQSYALYPHMNVYKNMAFGLKMKKEKSHIIDNRVKDVAKILNISHLLYKKPSEISGGQRQRVALGRAIVRKPSLFLMDEPLSNLDAKLRENMRIELVKLHQSLGSTTIYVTHDQTEAMTMGTKIILMHNQKIQQIGKPMELYNDPQNLFVANFIGNPTINSYRGAVEGDFFVSDSGLIKIKLSSSELEKIKKSNIKRIVLCIRSEEIKVVEKNGDVKITVIHIERLGKESEIRGAIDADNSITVTEKSDVEIEPYSKLDVKFNKYYIFDEQSELRI